MMDGVGFKVKDAIRSAAGGVQVAEILGDYRILREVGRGGMGVVRSAARLHHSNIVPVFDVGDFKRTHYYAMQFI